MTDAEVSHLRLAVATALRELNKALPPVYWRRRVVDVLESCVLLPTQITVLQDLVSQIDQHLLESVTDL